eukprot:scaffold2971_cov274-Pinguiococcus_pyrenoidosus.AAC.8
MKIAISLRLLPIVVMSQSAVGSLVLSAGEVAHFQHHGFVLLRQKVPKEDLARLILAAERCSEARDGISGPFYHKISFSDLEREEIMRKIATSSMLAHAAKQLLGCSDVRVLRDAFLAYTKDGSGCGWHVDDPHFWPSPEFADDAAGVNVWIALSPLRKHLGGGLAIAPTSHRVPWMPEALKKIRQPVVLPDGRVAQRTCGLAELSPEYNEKFEQLKETFDMEPGDALIMARYLWHRTDLFTEEGKKQVHEPLLRYSLRYMPGTSKRVQFVNGVVEETANTLAADKFPMVQ